MATADDGVLEAFYKTGERYIRAYQWHPERLYDIDRDNRKIFDDFVTVSILKKNSNGKNEKKNHQDKRL